MGSARFMSALNVGIMLMIKSDIMARIKCYICKRTMNPDFTGYVYFTHGKAICPRCMSESNKPKVVEPYVPTIDTMPMQLVKSTETATTPPSPKQKVEKKEDFEF